MGRSIYRAKQGSRSKNGDFSSVGEKDSNIHFVEIIELLPRDASAVYVVVVSLCVCLTRLKIRAVVCA